jgi:hypothetical protein
MSCVSDLSPKSRQVLVFLASTKRWYTTDPMWGEDVTTDEVIAQLRELTKSELVAFGIDLDFGPEINELSTYYVLTEAGIAAVTEIDPAFERSVA